MGITCPVLCWQDAVITSPESLRRFHAVLQDIRPSHLFTYINLEEFRDDQLTNLIPPLDITHLSLKVTLALRHTNVKEIMSGLLKNLRNMPLVLLVLELIYDPNISRSVRALTLDFTLPFNFSYAGLNPILTSMNMDEFATQLLQGPSALGHIFVLFSLKQRPDAGWTVKRKPDGSASLGKRLDETARMKILSKSPFKSEWQEP
ncbi:hypothetical protein EUX98_g943 [Antrodiella citrinella]|uniref:Uncharacterized protein n=1 Tax=Antrodiella citrinella TaxID=2447956 RepID=A0A4S4N2W0_9APHY|nr:hypothetical protein EUX98_g943 [Antrodiella citrinella]